MTELSYSAAIEYARKTLCAEAIILGAEAGKEDGQDFVSVFFLENNCVETMQVWEDSPGVLYGEW